MGRGYVLAMYDVRGKQEFIFRTNKLKEIVGGSELIRDVYRDYFYDAAQNAGGEIFSYRRQADGADFHPASFEKHLNDGYIGEVLYEGGGNFQLLLKNEDIFREVTYQFTKKVTEKIGTLRILGTCTEIENFDNYKKDRDELYRKHRINEAQESNIAPWACLPIVQVDRKTSQPLVYDDKFTEDKYTKEIAAKLSKYQRMRAENRDENEYILDNLVTEKGVESQLAVVYIDGNSMGEKVKRKTEGRTTYEECVREMRSFSQEIQSIYVDGGKKEALKEVHGDKGKNIYRIVVAAGDEINFIVNAHDALKCAENYLNYLGTQMDASACAGIAVFHSHTPYAEAYRIAEEACESGKKKMKGENEEKRLRCAAFVDYHICQGAIGTSLEDIRKEENGDVIGRPWMLWCDPNESAKIGDDITDYEKEILPILSFLKHFGRSNIKGLANAAKEGDLALKMEIERMYAHAGDADKEEWLKELKAKRKSEEKGKGVSDVLLGDNSKKVRGIIYDLAIAYDLWFADGEGV